MPQLYYRRHEVDEFFEPSSWQSIVYRKFLASLPSVPPVHFLVSLALLILKPISCHLRLSVGSNG